MPIHQAIILGIVQGLAEFLPISSSAHLILVPWVLGWDDPGLAFDVALHWGTLFAVLFVFWRDWIRLIGAGLRSLGDRRFLETSDRRLFWSLVVASIPGAIVGKLLGDKAEDTLRSPLLIAVTMSVMGVLLWWADKAGRKDKLAEQMTPGHALGIGVAQAFALIPGVSRSGSTITLGLALGYSRDAIARFSFLMSTPIIFGAGLLKFPKMLREMHSGASPLGWDGLAAGCIASAIVGAFVIRGLLAYLRTRTFAVFAVYRLLVSVGILVLWFSGKR
ncbi:MAG: undecaprenyl-diphosphate phosphatase [Deltaproteobacteria bacterium]|nr:MAG: undecaprenyl-diphosphate phosphatase [Deltaproteobacteria bacterium]TMB31517.1 MAG: undecaprenyl-diphosphate phosphatase [Deltaproteobacteria bacterium]